MLTGYPVVFDVARPERMDRLHVVVRLLAGLAMGLLGISLGWVFMLLYCALPAVAAIVLQARGREHYLERTGPALRRALRWILSFVAYLGFLTDRFPVDEQTLVRFEVEVGGTPTPGSAIMRLLTSLPEAIFLALLGIVSGFVWLLSLVCVLATASIPEPLHAFQLGVLRWQARLLAYHASLIDRLPPFQLVTGHEPRTT